MNAELLEAIRLLVRERGVDAEQLFEAIEESLVAAYKREFDAKTTDNIRAEVDRQTGAMNVYLMKEVVEEVEDPNAQIALSEALALDEDFEVGDLLEYELSPQDFGRLAAQSAKTAINLKLIQAERDRIQEEFSGLVGEVVTGVVQRSDAKEAIIDIERAEAVLSRNEQVRTAQLAAEPRSLGDLARGYQDGFHASSASSGIQADCGMSSCRRSPGTGLSPSSRAWPLQRKLSCQPSTARFSSSPVPWGTDSVTVAPRPLPELPSLTWPSSSSTGWSRSVNTLR